MYHTLVGPNECLVSFIVKDGISTHADTISMTTGHVCTTHVFNSIKPHIRRRQATNLWKLLLSKGYSSSY